MNTVELLHQALQAAERLGYGVRQEILNGAAGGACEVAGRRWLFVDLSLNTTEQLDEVIEALRGDLRIHQLQLPEQLAKLFDTRRAA